MIWERDGVHYHYEEIGQGPPVLLLHGFTGTKGTWEGLVNDLKKDFRVITIDLLGHGETDCPLDPTRYDITHAAKDLKELLDKLNEEKVHLLGYSMGGRLALAFACLFPERIASLLLESASPGLRTEEERRKRRASDEQLADYIETNGLEAFVDYWETIPLFSSQNSLPEDVKKNIREERLAQNPIGLSNSLRGMGTGKQPSFWERLQELEFPVFLITGKLDPKFCNIAEEMAERLQHVKKETVFHAGHTIHVEQKKIFGRMVYDWLIGQVDFETRRNSNG